MRVIEMRSWLISVPLVPEGGSFRYGTLGQHGHAVVVLSSPLVHAVPVNGQLDALHAVVHVNDHFVALAHLFVNKTNRTLEMPKQMFKISHLNSRTRHLSVEGKNTTLNTVSQNTLARVGGVGGTKGTGTGKIN